MGEAGMMFVESHEPVGEAERSELQTYGTTSRSMSKLAETILRLIFLMGLSLAQHMDRRSTAEQMDRMLANSLSGRMFYC